MDPNPKIKSISTNDLISICDKENINILLEQESPKMVFASNSKKEVFTNNRSINQLNNLNKRKVNLLLKKIDFTNINGKIFFHILQNC